MIFTTDLAKAYGAKTLFEHVSLQLNPRSRYGLVGANGSGKSTFLRILAGDEEPSEGEVRLGKNLRLGVLRQDRFLDDDAKILDLAMRGDAIVWEALCEQKRLFHPDTEAGSESGEPAADAARVAARLAELEERIAAHDGYSLESRAGAVLEGLGIPSRVHQQPLAILSGGFKLRVLLAEVLMAGADVLLLDEPTNHLDILSIRWLEKFLAGYGGCAVIISHDQRFLDNVTTHTLDVDYGTITPYTGNYSAFVRQKVSIREQKELAITRAQEEIARKREFVERFGAKATKARQAQSRLKQIERIEVEELAPSSRRAPVLRFVPGRPSGREVLRVKAVDKAFGENRVLTDVSINVQRGERLAIIGPNGLGKSTLLKILVGRLGADRGQIEWGHETRVSYFPQDHRERLDDPDDTPLEKLWAAYPGQTTTFVRGALGKVLFSGAEAEKPIGKLSGGESARLIFALLAAEQPNVLLLDEPTNHLDIEAIEALVESLKNFTGTLLFVSHDRWFVSELATRILELTPTGPRDFRGSYADYVAKCGDDHLDADEVVMRAKREQQARTASSDGAEAGSGAGASPGAAPSWEEQKRRRNRLAKLPKERDRLLGEIEAAEKRREEIDALYCTPGFFENTPVAEIQALEEEKAELEPRIEALMGKWEAVERELAELD